MTTKDEMKTKREVVTRMDASCLVPSVGNVTNLWHAAYEHTVNGMAAMAAGWTGSKCGVWLPCLNPVAATPSPTRMRGRGAAAL